MDSGREEQRALDRALRALARRAHSERELVDKLARDGYDEKIIARVMAKLSDYRLTDDEAFAQGWTRQRTRRGMGRYRIAAELRHKGVDAENVEMALSAIDEADMLANATEIAMKHLRRGDERARRRAYEALIRRGFDYDLARQALSAAEAALLAEED